MGANQIRQGFPYIPIKSWFTLRNKWQSSIPRGEINASYLASLLVTDETSAKKNVLRGLKSIGIVSDDGKLTELGMKWRIDETYEEACSAIVDKIYPHELIDLYPKPENKEEKQKVKDWFLKTGAGTVGSQQFGSFYCLLCDADLTQAEAAISRERQKTDKNSNGKAGTKTAILKKPIKSSISPIKETEDNNAVYTPDTQNEDQPQPAFPTTTISKGNLTLHIDIQIHISPESSENQIDSIFSSIAKYIYDKS